MWIGNRLDEEEVKYGLQLYLPIIELEYGLNGNTKTKIIEDFEFLGFELDENGKEKVLYKFQPDVHTDEKQFSFLATKRFKEQLEINNIPINLTVYFEDFYTPYRLEIVSIVKAIVLEFNDIIFSYKFCRESMGHESIDTDEYLFNFLFKTYLKDNNIQRSLYKLYNNLNLKSYQPSFAYSSQDYLLVGDKYCYVFSKDNLKGKYSFMSNQLLHTLFSMGNLDELEKIFESESKLNPYFQYDKSHIKSFIKSKSKHTKLNLLDYYNSFISYFDSFKIMELQSEKIDYIFDKLNNLKIKLSFKKNLEPFELYLIDQDRYFNVLNRLGIAHKDQNNNIISEIKRKYPIRFEVYKKIIDFVKKDEEYIGIYDVTVGENLGWTEILIGNDFDNIKDLDLDPKDEDEKLEIVKIDGIGLKIRGEL